MNENFLDSSENPVGDPINLLEKYSSVTREQVLVSNLFDSHYGQDYDVENLRWSEEFLCNSCDPELRIKVQENLSTVDKECHGGPLFFHEMMSIIFTMTADETDNMRESLKTMTLQQFKGENVEKKITLLRSCLKRLHLIGQVPLNINDILIRIFQTSSVPEFNKAFDTLSTFDGVGITVTPESIFLTAAKSYKKL